MAEKYNATNKSHEWDFSELKIVDDIVDVHGLDMPESYVFNTNKGINSEIALLDVTANNQSLEEGQPSSREIARSKRKQKRQSSKCDELKEELLKIKIYHRRLKVLKLEKELGINRVDLTKLYTYHWVDWNVSSPIPATAVKSGNDVDGKSMYVGKAYHNSEWIPAKVIPARRVAYVSHGGNEHMKSNCQVLCERKLEWQWSNDGRVPSGAIEGGVTSSGEILYIGRVNHNGSMPTGKIQPSHRVCYIPFGGREIPFKRYEVLVVKQ